MLDSKELERYARHIVLREVGGPGQAKLKAARVLVVGAGGLGAPVLLYLAAAGVGTLGVVDDDDVSLSNLQRQVIFATDDIGKPKVERAGDAVKGLNPHVNVETHRVRLTAANALDLIARYDIVADGSDNFVTRYLVADACYFARKPLVTAAVGTFDGSLTSIRAHETRADGTRNPDLSLPVSRTAGGGHHTCLCGSRNTRRTAGGARLADGIGGHSRDCGLR